MSVMTNYFEEKILQTARGTAASAPSYLYLALFLSDPTESGDQGTECSYSGYARQLLTLSTPAADPNVATNISTSNTTEILFPTPTAAAGTVTHAAIFDADTGGNMLVYKQLTQSIVLNSETAPRFAAGELALSMNYGNMYPDFKKAVFNWMRGTSITGFSPYLALYNGDPVSGGAELSGTGYSRIPITFDSPVEQPSGQMMIVNTNTATGSPAESNWGTWNYGVIMTASTGGDKFFYKQNAGSYIMNNSAQVRIESGAIRVALN